MTVLDQPLVRVCRCSPGVGLRCTRATLDDQPASVRSSCGYAIYPDGEMNYMEPAIVRFSPFPLPYFIGMLAVALLIGLLMGRGLRP